MDCEKLMALAERFLNSEGQESVETYLANGQLRLARICLLGALDKALQNGKVSDEELALAYSEIGMNPEEIADIRNRLPQY